MKDIESLPLSEDPARKWTQLLQEVAKQFFSHLWRNNRYRQTKTEPILGPGLHGSTCLSARTLSALQTVYCKVWKTSTCIHPMLCKDPASFSQGTTVTQTPHATSGLGNNVRNANASPAIDSIAQSVGNMQGSRSQAIRLQVPFAML